MKLKFSLILFLVAAVSFVIAVGVQAQSGIRVDQRCSAYLIQHPYEADGKPKCNLTCNPSCLDLIPSRSCAFGSTSGPCIQLTDAQIGVPGFNLFGVNWGPPQEAIPRVIRMLLTAVFGIISLVAILLGVYGMWVRSTAADNAEKAELAVKIFRNAVIGLIISFMGVAIVQVVALLLGLSGGLFNFNLIPSDVLRTSDGRSFIRSMGCTSAEEGVHAFITENGLDAEYACQSGVWVFYGR